MRATYLQFSCNKPECEFEPTESLTDAAMHLMIERSHDIAADAIAYGTTVNIGTYVVEEKTGEAEVPC